MFDIKNKRTFKITLTLLNVQRPAFAPALCAFRRDTPLGFFPNYINFKNELIELLLGVLLKKS